MRVTGLRLRNFRNYESAAVEFSGQKNIIIGENAQGKSNLLEAIEVAGVGRSRRADQDLDLISFGQSSAKLEVGFQSNGVDRQAVELEFTRQSAGTSAGGTQPRTSVRVSKQIKVNGVLQQSAKGLLGHIVFVSFAAGDLDLLRGGPRHRRDWLDDIACRLRPSFHDCLASYSKSVAQRNRLLKQLSERGRVTVSDQDELAVWDKQLARFGSSIIKTRIRLLDDLLPVAGRQQSHLSRRSERLEASYCFRAASAFDSPASDEEGESGDVAPPAVSLDRLRDMNETELSGLLMRLMKERRGEEIRRKQSTIGPHRDDIDLSINGVRAATFASQGQQRSIVLSLKLAELGAIRDRTGQTPVLLLDDVLAELDASRQSLLMSAVTEDMQTIITTTHLADFLPDWLDHSLVLSVASGRIGPTAESYCIRTGRQE